MAPRGCPSLRTRMFGLTTSRVKKLEARTSRIYQLAVLPGTRKQLNSMAPRRCPSLRALMLDPTSSRIKRLGARTPWIRLLSSPATGHSNSRLEDLAPADSWSSQKADTNLCWDYQITTLLGPPRKEMLAYCWHEVGKKNGKRPRRSGYLLLVRSYK